MGQGLLMVLASLAISPTLRPTNTRDHFNLAGPEKAGTGSGPWRGQEKGLILDTARPKIPSPPCSSSKSSAWSLGPFRCQLPDPQNQHLSPRLACPGELVLMLQNPA
jgi:hypothetical protein